MQNAVSSFDLSVQLPQLFRDFPQLLTTSAFYDHARQAFLYNTRPPETYTEQIERINASKLGHNSCTSFRNDTEPEHYLVCLNQDELLVPATFRLNMTEEQISAWTFDHELGHVLVPGGMAAERLEQECLADVYASLRHYQRYGIDSNGVDDIILTRINNCIYAAPETDNGRQVEYYTNEVLEKLARKRHDLGIMEMSPADTVSFARAFVDRHPTRNPTQAHKAFQFLTDVKYYSEDQLMLLADLALATQEKQVYAPLRIYFNTAKEQGWRKDLNALWESRMPLLQERDAYVARTGDLQKTFNTAIEQWLPDPDFICYQYKSLIPREQRGHFGLDYQEAIAAYRQYFKPQFDQKTARSSFADVYACLRHYQRYGIESTGVHHLMLSRAYDQTIFCKIKAPYTLGVLERLEEQKNKLDFKNLSPAETLAFTGAFLKKYAPSPVAGSAFFHPIFAGDLDQPDTLDTLLQIALAAKNRSVFLPAALILDWHLKTEPCAQTADWIEKKKAFAKAYTDYRVSHKPPGVKNNAIAL